VKRGKEILNMTNHVLRFTQLPYRPNDRFFLFTFNAYSNQSNSNILNKPFLSAKSPDLTFRSEILYLHL